MMDSETLIKETHELTVQWYKEQKEKVCNGIVLVVFVGMLVVYWDFTLGTMRV
jgi:hypothetical protein